MSDPADPGLARFEFRAARGAIWQGLVGGTLFMVGLAVWAGLTGRLHQVDATFVLIIVGCVAGSVGFVGWNILRQAGQAAARMGAIEVDDRGVRWRGGDGTIALDMTWTDIERVTVEPGTRKVLLHRQGAAPALLGEPSGFVELGDLPGLQRLLATRLPVEQHQGSMGIAAAGRVLGWGLATVATAVALYAANQALAARMGWTRGLTQIPALIGVVGLIGLAAGVRLRLGRGPMTSSLYSPAYPAQVRRMLLVTGVANFVLVAVINALR